MLCCMTQRHATILGIAALALVAVGWYWLTTMAQRDRDAAAAITSFEECAAAGYPILRSLPEQCATPDGRIFVREDDDSEVRIPNDTDTTQGTPEELPPPEQARIPMTVRGTFVCLPHRDTNGPVTLECAFGLRDEAGNYYALRDTDPGYGNLGTLAADTTIEVTGEFVPGEHERYQSIGTLHVTRIVVPES
jgi:hypothetical protein